MRYDSRRGFVHAVGFPTRTGQVEFKDIVHRNDLTRAIVFGVDFSTPEVWGHYEVHLKHWEGRWRRHSRGAFDGDGWRPDDPSGREGGRLREHLSAWQQPVSYAEILLHSWAALLI